MNGKLRVAIVDDEAAARELLITLFTAMHCEVVAEFSDGDALLAWLAGRPYIDALFLDIDMPVMNGLQTLQKIKSPPLTVFVTGHAEYAIEAFETEAIGYLLKPIMAGKLALVLEKIRNHQMKHLSAEQVNRLAERHKEKFSVKAGDGNVFVALRSATHFESENSIIWAWVNGERLRTLWKRLQDVTDAFPQAGLLQINRGLLVRPEAIFGARGLPGGRMEIKVTGANLEVSQSHVQALKERLGLLLAGQREVRPGRQPLAKADADE